jgi:2,4-dienoyl-CoA reductase-like NADH-dependent reductase (Old Yellow Enzyme family)
MTPSNIHQTTKMTTDIDLINSVVELPNGVRVPNRLVKASMEEGIGTGGGLPGKHHQRLYSRWAEGGWGMIITGRYLLSHRNIG